MSASSLCIQINKNENSRKDSRLADEIVRYSTKRCSWNVIVSLQ